MEKIGDHPMNSPNLRIRVPGTSANLGPGFDIMGLALDLFNSFSFHFFSHSEFRFTLEDGSDFPFAVEDNLLLVAYKSYFETYLPGKPIPGFHLEMELGLPIKGGLGSSASALIAGYFAGQYIHQNLFSEIEVPDDSKLLFDLAMMEGHPDNTTTAFLGGFVFSYFNQSELVIYKEDFPEDISMFLFIPKFETGTTESRKKLPEVYPVNDLIFNMSRIGTWFKFLQTGVFSTLKLAIQDKIHTDYRVPEGSFLDIIGTSIENSGGLFTLSGSGPTLLIFFPKEISESEISTLQSNLKNICTSHGILYEFTPTQVCSSGTELEKNSLSL